MSSSMIKLQYKKKGQQSCTQNECTIVGRYDKKIMPSATMHPVLCSFWHPLCRLICWQLCWHRRCHCLLCRCSRCRSCWCPLRGVRCVSVARLLCRCSLCWCSSCWRLSVHCALHWRSCFALAFVEWVWPLLCGCGAEGTCTLP